MLTFGAGPHYCLGVNLARAEMQEALAYLAPRMPDLRLDGEPAYGTIDGIYGLDALPTTPVGALEHHVEADAPARPSARRRAGTTRPSPAPACASKFMP